MKLGNRRYRLIAAAAAVIMLMLLGLVTRPAVRRRPNSTRRASPGSHAVLRVLDGDSLILDDGGEVRLAGINAPDKKWDECFADEARTFAKKLMEGKTVRLSLATEPVDKYGRNLAYAFMEGKGEEVFVNEELIRLGFAYANPHRPNWRHRERLLAAQKEAQASHRGLWAMTPAQCRHYVVETGPAFSLTHRPGCVRLTSSKYPVKQFESRLDALNHDWGAPPCRTCKP